MDRTLYRLIALTAAITFKPISRNKSDLRVCSVDHNTRVDRVLLLLRWRERELLDPRVAGYGTVARNCRIISLWSRYRSWQSCSSCSEAPMPAAATAATPDQRRASPHFCCYLLMMYQIDQINYFSRKRWTSVNNNILIGYSTSSLTRLVLDLFAAVGSKYVVGLGPTIYTVSQKKHPRHFWL